MPSHHQAQTKLGISGQAEKTLAFSSTCIALGGSWSPDSKVFGCILEGKLDISPMYQGGRWLTLSPPREVAKHPNIPAYAIAV